MLTWKKKTADIALCTYSLHTSAASPEHCTLRYALSPIIVHSIVQYLITACVYYKYMNSYTNDTISNTSYLLHISSILFYHRLIKCLFILSILLSKSKQDYVDQQFLLLPGVPTGSISWHQHKSEMIWWNERWTDLQFTCWCAWHKRDIFQVPAHIY